MAIPTNIPSTIRQGTTAKWTIFLPDYSPSGGWDLVYQFVTPTSALSVDATDNGDGQFLITIPADAETGVTTSDFAAGTYSFVALVSLGDDIYEVDHGQVQIIPSFSAEVDGRSQTKKDLEACDAFRSAKLAKGDVSSYSIGTGSGSRSLSSIPWPEFLTLHATIRAEYAREVQADRIARGLGSGRRINVRFGR